LVILEPLSEIRCEPKAVDRKPLDPAVIADAGAPVDIGA
jgi:hypothetical protein